MGFKAESARPSGL